MNQPIFISFLLLLLTACSSNDKNNAAKNKNQSDSILQLYIYNRESDDESNLPDDSLKIYSSSFEKSLELYEEIDSLEKQVYDQVYFSIFQLNREKFSIIIDSSTVKAFKFTNKHYKKIQSIDCNLGVNGIKLQKTDINTDGYKDILIEVPSGGFYGSAYFCLFYDPDTKSLVYDKKTELRNIEPSLKNRHITSHSSMQSHTYSIDKYKFKLIEKRIDLGKTTGIMELENKVEVSRFDANGKLIQKDTLVER
ncbi:XAC2610-related protein [Flavobacterium pedocola]